MSTRKAAVIDMGTNTFHLLLVEISGMSFKTIYKEKIPVKIGQGGINLDFLAPEALKRAMHTLRHFKNLISGEGIKNTFAFATSAIRNAKNGPEFVQAVKSEIGIDINVISGEQEAQLIYEGVKLSGSLNGQAELIMDIGGGSVEFIIGTSQEVYYKESFEIGGQRLMELFHHHDPILPEEISELKSYLSQKLQPLLEAIKIFNPIGLVGASGTFDTLTDMYFESILQSKLTGPHVFELPVDGFNRIYLDLLSKNHLERMAIPGMVPLRADMIVVAATLIDFILKLMPIRSITCSHYALKEGAISRLLVAEQTA